MLFCACHRGRSKEGWRMEVLNIKTIPHPSQKPKKSEVAMRLGLLETAGRHHVRVRGKRRRAFILLCLLRLPSFARNKTSTLIHIQVGESYILLVFPSIHLHLLHSTWIEMCVSYMSRCWKMVHVKATCKSQQLIFFLSGEAKKQRGVWFNLMGSLI